MLTELVAIEQEEPRRFMTGIRSSLRGTVVVVMACATVLMLAMPEAGAAKGKTKRPARSASTPRTTLVLTESALAKPQSPFAELAYTGRETRRLVGIGASSVLIGGVTVVAMRRRRPSPTPPDA
jgi:hypothetical protein